jgi:hypothetical protein
MMRVRIRVGPGAGMALRVITAGHSDRDNTADRPRGVALAAPQTGGDVLVSVAESPKRNVARQTLGASFRALKSLDFLRTNFKNLGALGSMMMGSAPRCSIARMAAEYDWHRSCSGLKCAASASQNRPAQGYLRQTRIYLRQSEEPQRPTSSKLLH